MKNTILIDFDGVIRHWSASEVEAQAKALGLAQNPLFACAFSREQSQPAITGKISHETWFENVKQALTLSHGQTVAQVLVSAWAEQQAEVDHLFLERIRAVSGARALVLVTNATSRLEEDLKALKLTQAFDHIMNSAVLGVAKPDTRFFDRVLEQLELTPSQCVFIDDRADNIEAARGMGIASCLHQSPAETLHFLQAQLGER